MLSKVAGAVWRTIPLKRTSLTEEQPGAYSTLKFLFLTSNSSVFLGWHDAHKAGLDRDSHDAACLPAATILLCFAIQSLQK